MNYEKKKHKHFGRPRKKYHNKSSMTSPIFSALLKHFSSTPLVYYNWPNWFIIETFTGSICSTNIYFFILSFSLLNIVEKKKASLCFSNKKKIHKVARANVKT